MPGDCVLTATATALVTVPVTTLEVWLVWQMYNFEPYLTMLLFTYAVLCAHSPNQDCPSLTKFHLLGTMFKSVKKSAALPWPSTQI